MDVSFTRAGDRAFAECLIRTNMRPYYEGRSIVWDSARFAKGWLAHDRYEIVSAARRLGLLCLEYDDQAGYIRDLLVVPQYRGQGVGTAAIERAAQEALARGLSRLRLKVFRDNPAADLYLRYGFAVVRKDADFYWMECVLSLR
jgi:GNAT superfamily N-acetyltransferase